MGSSRQATISPLRATYTDAFRETQQLQTSSKRLEMRLRELHCKCVLFTYISLILPCDIYTIMETGGCIKRPTHQQLPNRHLTIRFILPLTNVNNMRKVILVIYGKFPHICTLFLHFFFFFRFIQHADKTEI